MALERGTWRAAQGLDGIERWVKTFLLEQCLAALCWASIAHPCGHLLLCLPDCSQKRSPDCLPTLGSALQTCLFVRDL